jgi:hypothetical protein
MKKTGLYYLSLIVLLFMVYHLAYADEAKEEYLVYQYNENVRIILSKVECPKQYGGKRAAAQRIDKHYLKGCWTNDPTTKGNIKIQWIDGDSSTFPATNFYPAKE